MKALRLYDQVDYFVGDFDLQMPLYRKCNSDMLKS